MEAAKWATLFNTPVEKITDLDQFVRAMKWQAIFNQ